MQTSTCTSASSVARLALIGQSPAMERLRAQLRRIGPYFRTALIVGESGTGTAAIAEALHALSPASGRPLTAVTSVMDTHWTDGGTLFLPELNNLSPAAQSIVLLALRRGVRIIAATEHSPKSFVAAGRLHRDLYASLSTVEIAVPTLCTRPEDLSELVPAILGDRVMSPEFLAALQAHTWSGNLAELEQVLHDAARINGSVLENLPDALRKPQPEEPKLSSLQDVIDRHVFAVLSACAGNKLRAAEVLGISRSTLYRMLANTSQSLG